MTWIYITFVVQGLSTMYFATFFFFYSLVSSIISNVALLQVSYPARIICISNTEGLTIRYDDDSKIESQIPISSDEIRLFFNSITFNLTGLLMYWYTVFSALTTKMNSTCRYRESRVLIAVIQNTTLWLNLTKQQWTASNRLKAQPYQTLCHTNHSFERKIVQANRLIRQILAIKHLKCFWGYLLVLMAFADLFWFCFLLVLLQEGGFISIRDPQPKQQHCSSSKDDTFPQVAAKKDIHSVSMMKPPPSFRSRFYTDVGKNYSYCDIRWLVFSTIFFS